MALTEVYSSSSGKSAGKGIDDVALEVGEAGRNEVVDGRSIG